MLYRIESLSFVFCGAALLFIVLQPGTERLLEGIFPLSVKGFVMSLFEALSFSLMLFGVFGILSIRGVKFGITPPNFVHCCFGYRDRCVFMG